VTGRYHLGFPRDDEWENLDLKADTAGLSKAEG
jgi:acetolactate decarboxylase